MAGGREQRDESRHRRREGGRGLAADRRSCRAREGSGRRHLPRDAGRQRSGLAAGDEATRELADVAEDANGDREVRKSAVFALSQQKGRGVEYLLKIAQSNKDKEIRKQAIFWLGQSKDPRALDYFESVLTKK
jgi:hypothetical protein